MPYTKGGVVRWRGSDLPRLPEDRFSTAAINNAQAVLVQASSQGRGVLLHGPPGSGKTTLLLRYYLHLKKLHPTPTCSRRIYDTWMEEHCWWSQYTEFCNDVKAGYAIQKQDPTWGETYQPFGIASSCMALFIDDFGTGVYAPQRSTHSEDTFEAVFDARVRKGLPSFFTTNLTLDAIRTRFGERFWDRLLGTTEIIPLVQPTLRRLTSLPQKENPCSQGSIPQNTPDKQAFPTEQSCEELKKGLSKEQDSRTTDGPFQPSQKVIQLIEHLQSKKQATKGLKPFQNLFSIEGR